MNPASNETAGLQLSQPEQLPDSSVDGPALAEQAPAAPEKAPATGQAAPAQPGPPITLPLPPTAPLATPGAAPQGDVSATTSPQGPGVADDDDLIEKEWVNKAKQIVEANRDDPYKQSEELTVFRADYMKKRYGKNIKLSK